MKQKQINTIAGAKNAAQLIIGGITELGAVVHLPRNPKADIIEELTNTIMACGNHEQAKQVKVTRRSAFVDSINNAAKFCRVVRDFIKSIFGNEYSDLFMALGFHDTLAVSDLPEDLKNMLQAIVSYLTNNPTMEVGTLVTAVRAQALHDALVSAEDALASQELSVAELMNVRDEKYELLRKRITSVYQELRMELDPLDLRWRRFGFNVPGADETPDMVEGVQVLLIGPTAAAVKWDASARASYYRIYKRVVGVDADYVAVGSPADIDFTIENLPLNATIDIIVIAVNNGGESARPEPVRIVTHS